MTVFFTHLLTSIQIFTLVVHVDIGLKPQYSEDNTLKRDKLARSQTQRYGDNSPQKPHSIATYITYNFTHNYTINIGCYALFIELSLRDFCTF